MIDPSGPLERFEHPERVMRDELATRALLVGVHRSLSMLVKALDCYLQETRVPTRPGQPQNGPGRPQEHPVAARAPQRPPVP